jgi:hypothetical protein
MSMGTSQTRHCFAVVSDAEYYKAEALRFLEWASVTADPAIARRWRRLADDYIILAEQLEAASTGRPPILAPVQRQPVQQPQLKLRTDETNDC